MVNKRIGRHSIELSNTDKVLFPKDGVTKGDLIDYYCKIAEVMLPHIKDRPLTLHRFPDGIDADGFYQQQSADYFHGWIKTRKVPHAEDRDDATVEHVLCNDQETLAYLANQAVITLHGWLARAPRLNRPDRLIFDLDPASSSGFDAVRRAAQQVIELMHNMGMTPYVMTTGSRGLHVVTPLKPVADFDAVRKLAQDMAGILARHHEKELTVEQRKDKRSGRIYLDVMRNAYGQTAVMPYAVRAIAGAPVATPVDLDELDKGTLDPQRWNINNILRRLGQKEDPWSAIQRHGVTIDRARKILNGMSDND